MPQKNRPATGALPYFDYCGKDARLCKRILAMRAEQEMFSCLTRQKKRVSSVTPLKERGFHHRFKVGIRGAKRPDCQFQEEMMTTLKDVLRYQPYPCFKLNSVPETLKHQLKKGMLCLYNIDKRIYEFPTVGQFGPAEKLLSYLDFVGYYSIEDFRDLVFAGRIPVNCPSCKGPVEDAGMISFELEEPGTAQIDCASGDAEIFVCEFCSRTFALMPIT